jgi:hypothetical protein
MSEYLDHKERWLIKIKHTDKQIYFRPNVVRSDKVFIPDAEMTYEEMLESWIFADDNTPCGVEI